jgi:hypothetical protein
MDRTYIGLHAAGRGGAKANKILTFLHMAD